MNKKKFSKSLLGLAVALSVNTALAADAYRLVEIKADEEYKNNIPSGINNNGEIVGNASTKYNVPIFNEPYLADLGLPQEEIDANDYSAANLGALRSLFLLGTGSFRSNPEYQKISDRSAFTANLGATSDDQGTSIVLTDVMDEEQATLTNSTESRLSAINDSGVMVGYASAPFISSTNLKRVADDESEEEGATKDIEVKIWNRANTSRATVTVNNDTTVIEPSFATYGGRSAAYDISNSGYIAGAQSTAFTHGEDTQTAIDTYCENNVPYLENEALCSMLYQGTALVYLDTAVIWQVDGAGNLVDTMAFPIDFELTEETTGIYSSAVSAVNNNGEGTGYGRVPRETNEAIVAERAMVFANGQMNRIPIEHDQLDSSEGTDINDSGVVVGNHNYYGGGSALTSKYFIYNPQTNTVEYPTTFFASAESSAAAINNSGVVVGTAEYELSLSDVKRSHGFVYDSVTEVFRDLNNVIACGSEFEIVAAQDINDEGQILATALTIQHARGVKGDFLYEQQFEYEQDADGNNIPETETLVYVLDDNGEKIPVNEAVLTTVRLDPIDSVSEESCDTTEPYERQGFSFGWISALLLSGLVGIRRRFL